MKFQNWSDSSNPLSSTFQPPNFRRCRRIARNPRVCARFAITHGPGERLRRRESPEYGKSYPGGILLGPSVRQARGFFGTRVRSAVRIACRTTAGHSSMPVKPPAKPT